MCVYLYHIQKTTLKVGSAIYKLVGLVKYHNRHYSSFIRSTENNTQWFYISDTNVCTKLYFIQSITNNTGYSC